MPTTAGSPAPPPPDGSWPPGASSRPPDVLLVALIGLIVATVVLTGVLLTLALRTSRDSASDASLPTGIIAPRPLDDPPLPSPQPEPTPEPGPIDDPLPPDPIRDAMAQQDVADAFLAAFLADDPDEARRFTLPGQDPDAYDYLEMTWRDSPFLADRTRCLPGTWYCEFSEGTTGADVLVVDQRDGRWVVSGAGLSLIGPDVWDAALEALLPACTRSSAPLRTGPGTVYPAVITIPVGTCGVYADPYSEDGMWRAATYDGRPGFVLDDDLDLTDGGG